MMPKLVKTASATLVLLAFAAAMLASVGSPRSSSRVIGGQAQHGSGADGAGYICSEYDPPDNAGASVE